jgi:hypothetical protein
MNNVKSDNIVGTKTGEKVAAWAIVLMIIYLVIAQ